MKAGRRSSQIPIIADLPHLVLTKRGQTALVQLSKSAARSHTKLAGRLTGTDIAAIHRGLRRMITAMNNRE